MIRQAYICGPYTASSDAAVLDNISRALRVACNLAACGYHPIVPHSMGYHRSTTWEEAMDRCIGIISGLDPERDILVVCMGWEHSRGSREEVNYAQLLGITVLSQDFFEVHP